MDKSNKSNKSVVACIACKATKKRCNGDYLKPHIPCSNCSKKQRLCEYNQKLRPDYVKLLEEKVEYLREQLEKLQNEVDIKQKSCPAERYLSPGDNLVECAAFIPLKDDSNPIYVGSSSFNIANLIQCYLVEDEKNEKVDFQHNDNFEDISNDPNSLTEILLDDESLMNYFFQNYLELIHKRYPFLDKSHIQGLHKERVILYHSRSPKRQIDRFLILMVYAVGSYLRTTNFSIPHVPFARLLFYKAAINSNVNVIFGNESVSSIQTLLLIVVYKLRTPQGQTIWHLIGIALKLCISLGLHRKNLFFLVNKPYEYVIRSRIFWVCYSLDRTISNSFGRPFSLNDRDIDVPLPLNIDESITDPNEIKNAFYLTYPQYNYENFKVTAQDLSVESSISRAIKTTELRLIDSKIQEDIYSVQSHFDSPPRDLIQSLSEDMKCWINSLPSNLSPSDHDYYIYVYNKQIRHLIVPFINKLEPDDLLFKTCIKSSVTVCRMSRKIHDNGKLLLSIIGIQSLFLSGITVVYAILADKVKWDFDVSEGLRCCSTTLFVVSERCPSVKKFSVIFERLICQLSKSNHQIVDLFSQNCLDINPQKEITTDFEDVFKSSDLNEFLDKLMVET